MKIVFILLVFVHGIIHVMGFLKAYGIAQLSQLTLDISKPTGALWLLTAFFFLAFIFLFIFQKEWVWILGIVAIILSQTLIILQWQDAKFGTIPNLVILVVCIIGLAMWNFTTQTNKEISGILSETNTSKIKVITEQMLSDVPIPVQDWLQQIGVVGKEEIHNVYFQQEGEMKLKPNQKKWTSAVAEQYVTIENPAFLWRAKMNMLPFVHIFGRDLFMDGKGNMQIKVAALIPVVHVFDNKKVNQSTLARFLLELPLYPTAALHPYVTWKSINEQMAEATITYKDVAASAVYYFNDGELEKVSALRYKDHDQNANLIECVGEFLETKTIDGITIPTNIEVSWMLEEGKFTWFKFKINQIQFMDGSFASFAGRRNDVANDFIT